MSATLEVASFDPQCAVRAASAGANRIELCRDYRAGGLTPSLTDIAFVKERVHVPVFVMIREHADGFVFSSGEHARMRISAREIIDVGADGIVFGALLVDGRVDENALREMVEAVAPKPVTFHRAFDEARDPLEALDAIIRCGGARVLTSGGQPTALEGAELIARLVERAGNDLIVIPGGAVRTENVLEILDRTGAVEIHSAARATEARVDPEEVRRLVEALA